MTLIKRKDDISSKIRSISASKKQIQGLKELLEAQIVVCTNPEAIKQIYNCEDKIILDNSSILKFLGIPEILILQYRKKQYQKLAESYEMQKKATLNSPTSEFQIKGDTIGCKPYPIQEKFHGDLIGTNEDPNKYLYQEILAGYYYNCAQSAKMEVEKIDYTIRDRRSK